MLKKSIILFIIFISLPITVFYSTRGIVISKVNEMTVQNYSITTAIENYYLGLFPPRLYIKGLTLSDAKGELLSFKSIFLGLNHLEVIGGALKRIPILPESKAKDNKTGKAGFPINSIKIKDFTIDKLLVFKNDSVLIDELSLNSIKLKGDQFSFNLKKADLSFKKSKISLFGKVEKVDKIKASIKLDFKELDLDILASQNSFKGFPGIKGRLNTKADLILNDKQVDLKFEVDINDFSYTTKESAKYLISKSALNGSFKGSDKSFSLYLEDSNILGFKQTTQKGPAQGIDVFKINAFEYKKKETGGHYLKTNLNRDGTVVLDSDSGYFNLDIDNLDLKNFSDFLIIDSNNNIDSGKLFSTYRSKIDPKDNIDGKLVVSISQLNFKESGGGSTVGSFMSITKAVGIVKDDNGKVKLDSKIEGKMSDPEFDIISYISKGIGSIIADKFYSLIAVEAAKRVAPLLLSSIPINPLNALTLIKAGYKFAVKPRFNDLKFSAHSSTISGRELKTLERVVTFLKAQKQVSLSFCPKTFLKEKDSLLSLSKALLLNKERMESVLGKVQGLAPGVEKQIVFCGLPKTLESEGIGSLNIQI